MSPELKQKLDQEVSSHKVVLFMKGNAMFPQCGFSAAALQMIQPYAEIHTVDVLADPEVRQGIKEYSNWPTIPQLYVGGKFVGGADIVRDLAERGELEALLKS